MTRFLFVPVLTTALVGAPFAALAQSDPAPAAEAPAASAVASALPAELLMEIDRDDMMVAPFNITVEELDGMTLFGADGSQFGEIEAVLGNSAGEVAAFAIEIGGFLGVGDRQVIFPIELIRPDGLRLTVDLTAADMEQHAFWAE